MATRDRGRGEPEREETGVREHVREISGDAVELEEALEAPDELVLLLAGPGDEQHRGEAERDAAAPEEDRRRHGAAENVRESERPERDEEEDPAEIVEDGVGPQMGAEIDDHPARRCRRGYARTR